ncbi:MAG: hypothetical protein MJ228_03655 [Bacilli bacterium]|nr:hypothetical protein [Bacilli bacterium]
MGWPRILLYILIIVILLILVYFSFVLYSILNFDKKLAKRTVAISVILSQKRELLQGIFTQFDEAKVNINSSLNKVAAQVRWLKLENLKGEDIEASAVTLKSFEKHLAILGQKYPIFDNDKDYKIYWETIDDLNSNYRRNVANYNSEVLGYEYWRKVLIFRPILHLMGFRKERKRLS